MGLLKSHSPHLASIGGTVNRNDEAWMINVTDPEAGFTDARTHTMPARVSPLRLLRVEHDHESGLSVYTFGAEEDAREAERRLRGE